MQSRRHTDSRKLSPSGRLRKQPRYEVGHDSYAMSRREAVDRSPRMLRRSLSPRGSIESSRRMFLGEAEERRDSRDYGRHLGGGRGGPVRSRSPPYMGEPNRPHFDEGVVHRKYYLEEMDYDDERKRHKSNQVYGYDHLGVSSRMNQDSNDSGNRMANFDKHRMMEQKPMLVEDRMMRGSYQVSPDLVPGSRYGETERYLPLMSQCEDIGRIECENFRRREPISSDKLPVRELHKEREKPLFDSRDGSYTVKTSQPLDFGSTSEFEDFSGISSEFSRTKFPSSYREGMPLPAPGEYSRSSMKPTEPMDHNIYRQRSVEDIRDHEYSKRLVLNYPQDTYSGKRNGHDNYIYTKSRGFMNDDMYPSDDLQDLMSSHHYENVQTNYESRESSRPIIHTSAEMIDHPEDYGTTRKSTAWDYHAMQKQVAAENVDTGRRLYVPQRDEEYMGSELTQVRFGQRDSREMESSHLSISEDYPISQRRPEYGFGRDAGPQFRAERLQDSPASTYDLEMQRLATEGKRVKEDLDIYEQTDKFLTRKYLIEEGARGYDTSRRGTMPSNWSVPKEFEDPYGSSNEWVYEGRDALRMSRTRRTDHTFYTNAKRKTGGKQHPGYFAYKDSSSVHDSIPHAQRHTAKQYKSGVKYVKGQARSENSYNLHHTDKRSGIHRQHNNLKYNDFHGEDDHDHDDDTSQDRMHLAESELSEDSEEFKQVVEEAFLSYSKQLNLKSAVRRKFKEQGKAGSLFCIVCGRSSSKEFLDTRRLVTHAYMSRKHGLRAQHLGLYRAICVLMGWNTFVPSDAVTWVPEVLPDTEALAQKEDLMLWPPLVIIHNISMSNNNPETQKVVPIEGVEAFLRGKGFVGGKIKVYLGKPADQSVMLVKFLGTFTGLGNAEKLHRYFAENKRGRAEFEQMTSNGRGSSSHGSETGKKGERVEEHLLYGYIGIADDFDKLDFNTKKWITIKSRKEIQDLANAPVKTEDA